MESDSVRARRLEIAQEESLLKRFGSDGLIAGTGADGNTTGEIEKIVVENPIDGACYDALVYLRDGMTRDEAIDIILLRNRIKRSDAEQIVDRVIEERRK